MKHYSPGRLCHQIQIYRQELATAPSLPLSEELEQAQVAQVVKEARVKFRERVYSPIVTLWIFLWQVLSREGSCRQGVSRLRAHQVACGHKPSSARTGSYWNSSSTAGSALVAYKVGRLFRDGSER